MRINPSYTMVYFSNQKPVFAEDEVLEALREGTDLSTKRVSLLLSETARLRQPEELGDLRP